LSVRRRPISSSERPSWSSRPTGTDNPIWIGPTASKSKASTKRICGRRERPRSSPAISKTTAP